MSNPLTFDYTVTFNNETVEWDLVGSVEPVAGLSNAVFLKSVWITKTIVEEELGSNATKAGLLDLLDDAYSGGRYIRPILPSELGEFMSKDSVAEEILSRYQGSSSNTGTHKSVTGYYFYLDSAVRESFYNHDLVSACVSQAVSYLKSHSGLYSVTSEDVVPINSTVYSAIPARSIIGENTVLGARAGDVFKHKSSGGSGTYDIRVAEADAGYVEISASRIRIVKNETRSIEIKVYDLTDDAATPGVITINVEEA